MTATSLAADIASRIPEMSRDNPINNAAVIESLLKMFEAEIKNAERQKYLEFVNSYNEAIFGHNKTK